MRQSRTVAVIVSEQIEASVGVIGRRASERRLVELRGLLGRSGALLGS